MLTSILHRITGASLVIGSLVIVGWLIAVAMGAETLHKFSTILIHPISIICLVGWSWAFWYQLLNGVRHLIWDAGYGFDLSTAKKTGLIILSLSFIFTALTWAYLWIGG